MAKEGSPCQGGACCGDEALGRRGRWDLQAAGLTIGPAPSSFLFHGLRASRPRRPPRSFAQASLGAFLGTAAPALEELEGRTLEMQRRTRALCEYFGAGGAGGAGGSSAHVLDKLLKFTVGLASATANWERKNRTTVNPRWRRRRRQQQ